MAKKRTKRKRKKRPLKANPKRQAHAQLRGYLYQIWHSVDAWLDLANDEVLYLEGAEDFDKISGDTATAVQVKDTRHKITLRSQEVIDAINHYWELQDNNRDRRVKFRFLTRSRIGMEQGSPFGKNQLGLDVWQRCSGDEAAIIKISEFLQHEGRISEVVVELLKKAEPQQIYEQLIEPITWETGSKEASFVEKSINDKLVHHGDRYNISPSDAKKVADHLLTEVWKVATQKENRELTRVRFLEIFEEKTTLRVPIQHTRTQQPIDLTVILDKIKAVFPGGISDLTIQSQPFIRTDIPMPPPYVVPRPDLFESIQATLQSEGIAVIQGGVEKGKTTLAKLTAKAINDSWFWLDFRNIKSEQVVQLLQQLAVEISNQSSQINVVLDDLDLRPQELRGYEEDLGVVVYRVLERGAKLLITSQYKLPNNFSRHLNVSRSVIINVPNFTISEIEQFAQQLGCPADDAKIWAKLTHLHTSGHPRLVHARLAQLQTEGWKQDRDESILQTPRKVVEEREEARQFLIHLPKDQQELLYRLSLMPTGFRKDYVLNIGEIPKPIHHPGDIFDQLVGPWIDQVDETYYTISPLLANAAKEVCPESRINQLHAQVANAILKTKDLTTMEAQAILFHSTLGQNKTSLIAVIQALMTVTENDWKELSQNFLLWMHVKTDPPEELFPGDAFVNYLFRSFQYGIAVEVAPESAPKILKIWDKEAKPYEPYQLYLQSRLMLAMHALIYYQVPLPVKQMVGYLKEIIDIMDNTQEIQEIYFNFMGDLEENQTDKSDIFSILFNFILARQPFYVPFLNDLIDALDELDSKMRALILADFKADSIDSRILIDNVWFAEANLENPDWTRCLQVFDRVIERSLAWGYPHIAAASARGKAIIHDEYLHTPGDAYEVLQDILSKLGPLPVIEEEQAVVHFHQKHYNKALDIYERLLPNWHPPSEKLNIGPLEEYHRAAICAAHLNDWEKAATFFENGAKIVQRIENTERYIGLYADAGFAQFKAGNMVDSIRLLNLALQKFEMLSQDNTDAKYFTLKQRLGCTIRWVAEYETENYSSVRAEPPAGFCSNTETNEKILTLPDFPMRYSWLYLAQIEYKFGHGTTVLDHALQITAQAAYPELSFLLVILEVQHDFRNKTFDNLPQRMHQLTKACDSIQRHNQTGKGIGEKGVYSKFIADLSDVTDVKEIIGMLAAALLVQLPAGVDMRESLAIWRSNSSELPIENMVAALNLIESMLSENQNNALTVMKTHEAKYEERLVAALKIVHNTETSPENLFHAHTFIVTGLIGQIWEDLVVTVLAELLSAQWLEKIKFRATLKTPMITVPQIEQACNSNETGKKKIGQILLAVYQAVSVRVAPEILQQFRSWIESSSKQKREPTTGKNPIAQRLITAMEKPPHLTDEDVEALRQSIEEGKMPIKFDSPFEPDEREKQ